MQYLGQRNIANTVIEDSFNLGYSSSNQGHSAQFHSTYANRQEFWLDVLAESLELVDEENDYTGLR